MPDYIDGTALQPYQGVAYNKITGEILVEVQTFVAFTEKQALLIMSQRLPEEYRNATDLIAKFKDVDIRVRPF